MKNILSENIEPKLLFAALDIGGTNTADAFGGTANANHWVSLENNHRVAFILFLGVANQPTVWNDGDDIATVTIEQATAADGTGLKAVASQTYTITANDLDANGDVAIFEVKSEDLDADGGFTHVRPKVAMSDNNGVNNVTCVAVLYDPIYSKIGRDRIEVIRPNHSYGA